MKSEDITLFSEVITRIRNTIGRDEFRSALRFEKSDHAMISTPLSELKLAGEGIYEWQNFFHHTKVDNNSGWLRITTEDRHGLLGAAHELFLSLEGLPIHVTMSKSWRWIRHSAEAAGKPQAVDVYEFLLTPRPNTQAENLFVAQPLVEHIQNRVCASHDPRAERTDWFDRQTEVAGKILFGSYAITKFGLRAHFEHKNKAEAASELLFKDCKTILKKDNSAWVMDIIFPDMVDAHKNSTQTDDTLAPLLVTQEIA